LISSILHASARVGKPSHSPAFPRSKPRSFHRVRSKRYGSRGLRSSRGAIRSTPGTDLAGREEVAGSSGQAAVRARASAATGQGDRADRRGAAIRPAGSGSFDPREGDRCLPGQAPHLTLRPMI
jgi:hypothetical protein